MRQGNVRPPGGSRSSSPAGRGDPRRRRDRPRPGAPLLAPTCAASGFTLNLRGGVPNPALTSTSVCSYSQNPCKTNSSPRPASPSTGEAPVSPQRRPLSGRNDLELPALRRAALIPRKQLLSDLCVSVPGFRESTARGAELARPGASAHPLTHISASSPEGGRN